jgi:hypothetical protein
MTLLDGDSLLDVLGFEIERVVGLRERLARVAREAMTSRPRMLYDIDQAVERAVVAKQLGFEAQRASVAELRRFGAK